MSAAPASKHCILHVGMPKTGTSSIQETFFNAPKAALPFEYLHLGQAKLSEAIWFIWRSPDVYDPLNQEQKADPRAGAARQSLLQQLTARIRQSEGDILLSAEVLCVLAREEQREFLKWLQAECASIRAFAYIRAPRSYIPSLFQQILTYDATMKGLSFEFFPPRYKEFFFELEEFLGRTAIEYIAFDPARFPGRDVVQDFCGRLGVAMDPQLIKKTNEGLGLDAVRFLYTQRRFGRRFSGAEARDQNARLIQSLKEMPGRPFAFCEELIQPLIQRIQPEIRWIESRLGTTLDDEAISAQQLIRSETDLFEYSAESLCWLGDRLQLGSRRMNNLAPAEIAELVSQLGRAGGPGAESTRQA